MKQFLLILFLSINTFLFATGNNAADNLFDRVATESTATSSVVVTFSDGKLTVENAPQSAVIEIYSMLGVSVFKATMKEPRQSFIIDLKKGYYIVRIDNLTKKISIK